MTKVKQDYMVGLDIGTNSCGWVATDQKNNILHLNGKNAIGARLFEEGHPAADRRSFRTTRRRLKRRKWRLGLLEEIFDPYMAEVDPAFFRRLKESSISPLDSRKKYSSIIFPTREEEQKFNDKYPTIYHLRAALMNEDRKFDLREVFLAIHHIVKYRGNFLRETPISKFNPSKIDVKATINKINDLYKDENVPGKIRINDAHLDEIEAIIRNDDMFKQDKVKQISQLLAYKEKDDKNQTKQNKVVAKQISNAILGYKAKFEDILSIEVDKDERSDWEYKLSSGDADDKYALISSELSDEQSAIYQEVSDLFSAIELSKLVDEGKTFSETMVRKYKDHKKQLRKLKKIMLSHPDPKKAKNLRLAYDLYVNNRHSRWLEAKKAFKTNKVLSKEDFEKLIEKNLDDSPEAHELLDEIKKDTFMPKQRTNQNGNIPFQLQQKELDKIIENQSKYYPFLAEENPIVDHQSQAPYKLDELVRFRIPYYVGPLITQEDQKKSSKSNFAWMVRKEAGNITPWNFDEKIDRDESADKFIHRMTTKDTYLLGEDVLPANSLLYEKFKVLNELNIIRINDRKLSVRAKQSIYNELFKKNKTITKDRLVRHLKTNYGLPVVNVKGLPKSNKFNSSLATYNRFRNLHIFDDKLDDPAYRKDIEQIIEWSSIFEDKKIFARKLQAIKWLTPDQIKVLANVRLQGWGNLSRKLLTGLHDENGQNIIERLWDGQQNFMQIVNEPIFKEQITRENQDILSQITVDDLLEDAYTSPANKKAIRQVLKVVDDIVKAANGKAPAQFAIEFAREAEKNPKLSDARGKKLREAYDTTAKELVDATLVKSLDSSIKKKRLLKDKYFLYFTQAGRDAYTGEKIDIDSIDTDYQIDHILPQAFIKDDSLNNRVLVKTKFNAAKSDDVPVKHYGNKFAKNESYTIRQMWDKWYEMGLISKQKHNTLLLDPNDLDKYQISGFINRQLVETSQIIKLVSSILQAKYPDSEIIVVKASYNHYLRNRLNLYKSRSVNDYHHAIDAYLSTICGNYLYQVHPNLRPFFVYGQYKKFADNPDLEKYILDHQRRFNFIGEIFDQGNKDEIAQKGTGKVVFSRKNDIIDKLHKAYNYKFMLTSRETGTRNQEMFGMTLYPRSSRDTAKTRKLIPKKKDLPTEIYGGYTNNSDAYMALAKIEKAKEIEYRIVGVPMRYLNQVKKSKDKKTTLKKLLAPSILFNKNGKPIRGIKDFEIIREKIPYAQLIQDGDKKFRLSSSTYIYNGKQMTLSKEVMGYLTNNFEDNATDEIKNQDLNKAYKAIVDNVNKYLPLFDINRFREKLTKGQDKFEKLDFETKKQVLENVLNSLHNNMVQIKIPELGLTTPLGFMQIRPGVKLSENAKLIFQSPSGLFEKQIKVSNL